MSRLQGKVAVVTGAGSGIGRGTALRFAQEGASVLCADIVLQKGEQTAHEIGEAGGTATAVQVDVSIPDDVDRMAQAAIEQWGRVDVLYACAGAIGTATALTCDMALWQKNIAVNMTGSWLCAKAVLPSMMSAGGGSLIFQSSTAGVTGVHTVFPYAAAKGGIQAMARQIAMDFGEHHVRSNVIAVGTVRTPGMEESYEQRVTQGFYQSAEEGIAAVAQHYPLGRIGTVSDCADLAVYLASKESSWMTGLTLALDGGLTSTRGVHTSTTGG